MCCHIISAGRASPELEEHQDSPEELGVALPHGPAWAFTRELLSTNRPRSSELSLKAPSPRGGSGEVTSVAWLGPAATAGLGTVAVPATTAAKAG